MCLLGMSPAPDSTFHYEHQWISPLANIVPPRSNHLSRSLSPVKLIIKINWHVLTSLGNQTGKDCVEQTSEKCPNRGANKLEYFLLFLAEDLLLEVFILFHFSFVKNDALTGEVV